jgi:hypothetical protein
MHPSKLATRCFSPKCRMRTSSGASLTSSGEGDADWNLNCVVSTYMTAKYCSWVSNDREMASCATEIADVATPGP